MATILIWMSPEPGHVLPTVKVARDLQRRGHRVVYLAPAGTDADLRSLGFETAALFPRLAAQGARAALLGPPRSARHFYDAVRTAYGDHGAFLEGFRHELRRAVRSVAAELVLVDGVYDEMMDMQAHQGVGGQAEVVRLFTHLPYRPIPDWWLAPERGRAVFLSPPEFEMPELRRAEAHYTEPAVFDSPDVGDFPWHRLEAGRPLVYCSLGTQAERYPRSAEILGLLIEAARNVPSWQVVVNAGAFADRLGSPEEDVLIVPAVYPQLGLLRRAAAMITSGGFGTLKDCIYAGVPTLVMPMRWDQPANADRVRRHGVGLTLPESEATPQAVERCVRRLLEPGDHHTKLRQLQDVFVRAQRSAATADLCEQILAARSPTAPRRAGLAAH